MVRGFTALLHGWTRGNPFFIEEVLKTLVASGHLHRVDGRWVGWELHQLALPPSIRDAVVARVDRLSSEGRTLAEYAAVIGARVPAAALAAAPVPDSRQAGAIRELLEAQLLEERLEGEEIVYHFVHPILRDTLYDSLGPTRARAVHAAVAQAIEEAAAGTGAEADTLAYHYSRAGQRELAPKAVRYLVVAGRSALAKHANREAADYLSAALEKVRSGVAELDAEQTTGILDDLARARQRLGDHETAMQLWQDARTQATEQGDSARVAAVERRMGLARLWTGHPEQAMQHFDAGIGAARAAGDHVLETQLRIARGACLQGLGRAEEAREELMAAQQTARGGDDVALGARVERALLQLHIWSGPPETARQHGQRAIELALESGDRALLFSVEWAMAVLEGLAGSFPGTERHLRAAEAIAEELRSPLLRTWTSELAIEVAAARGEWDAALALGAQAIATARALNQRALLPRLLVWTGLIHLGRNEIEKGRSAIDEAWRLAGVDDPDGVASNVHVLVPAHIGRAGYHLAVGEYREAIRIGEAGLEIVDRNGYGAWGIHRLLPIIAESYLWLRDLDGARRIGRRLRADSERYGHVLGLAWADACDALVAWLSGDSQRGAVLLRGAAEALEAIPFIPDAARLRRQLAGRLAEIGDREGAVQELRRVHEILVRLGAEGELEKARAQFREIGSRPPVRGAGQGAAGMTGRELEIARLVAERRSNKAIARALGISPRTVGTHISNIFRKLEIGSREELGDLVRDGAL